MLKCTAFFSLGIQGWSETWYLDGSNLNTARAPFATLVTCRLSMCPPTVSILGIRISVVENPAVFRVEKWSAAGTYTTTRDITNMAIFFEARTDDYTRRQVITRGTPDDCVVNGAYVPTANFSTAVINWANAQGYGNFCIRTIDRTQPISDIQSIDGTGLMTTYLDYGWDKPDALKFFRAKTTDGKPIKKSYKISARLTGTTYQLVNWPAGKLAFNVKARKLAYVLKKPTFIGNGQASSRKTGRPFGLRAGRRRVTVQ